MRAVLARAASSNLGKAVGSGSGSRKVVQRRCSAAKQACRRFSPETLTAGLCMARTWNAGRGGQCRRTASSAGCLCVVHLAQAKSSTGLVHGRVDGPVPAAKLREFERAALRAAGSSVSAARSDVDAGGRRPAAPKAWLQERRRASERQVRTGRTGLMGAMATRGTERSAILKACGLRLQNSRVGSAAAVGLRGCRRAAQQVIASKASHSGSLQEAPRPRGGHSQRPHTTCGTTKCAARVGVKVSRSGRPLASESQAIKAPSTTVAGLRRHPDSVARVVVRARKATPQKRRVAVEVDVVAGTRPRKRQRTYVE